MTPKKAYVDYYSEHEISPVSQDISDINKHFERRTSLYKDLGIPPVLISKSSIMEVGPGSGYNSIHLAQFKPEKYTLIEPNKPGRDALKKLFETHVKDYFSYDIFEGFIQDYSCDYNYDIVIGEGFLGLLPNASEILQLMGSFVKPSGVLCCSTSDSVSYFADILKRVIGVLLIDPNESFNEQIAKVIPVFEQLMRVDGMSRPVKDWVADNVMQPMDKNCTFSIADAIDSLEKDFIFYNSSSPNYKTDWRWYKQQCNQGDAFNDYARKQYYENVHNLLDYRVVHGSRAESENKELLILCEKVFENLKIFENNRNYQCIDSIIHTINEIQCVLKEMNLGLVTIQALEDFKQSVGNIIDGESAGSFNSFSDFSGRGQQYLSFLKKHPPYLR